MARTVLSQFDFERALEERIEQIKPLLKQELMLDDNEEEINRLAEAIAARKIEPMFRILEEKNRVINRQSLEIDLLESRVCDLRKEIPRVISKGEAYSTLES